MITDKITVTANFKKQTVRAVFSIFLFIIVYLLLLCSSILLTAACIFIGASIIVVKPGLITLFIGVGVISMGISILVFLLKFINKTHKNDLSTLIEITEAEEPKLVALINNLASHVGTRAPKKIYLSADVNAQVFYDSSFWSMFLPVKKNLQIGLGLVNTVTQQELKAILAHEFGHFSQKTMRLGSYTYNVNQVIYNLVNEDDRYLDWVNRWARSSWLIYIFVMIALYIVKGIKWILIKMYAFVNKQYLALSREMEFQADEIAAKVTGYQPLKSALLRSSLADYSLNSVLAYYRSDHKQEWTSENIYPEQTFVLGFLAKDMQLPVKYNLPQVPVHELGRLNKSKLVIKDQWASHPSTKDRITRLEETNLNAEVLEAQPANELFTQIELWQKQFTNTIFEERKKNENYQLNNLPRFKETFIDKFTKGTFPKIFNGYYDDKDPVLRHIEMDVDLEEHVDKTLLFSDERIEQIYIAIALKNDFCTLQQIADKRAGIATFDYNGKKYKRKQAKALAENIREEGEKLFKQISKYDQQIFLYFSNLEIQQNKQPQLKKMYQNLNNFDAQYEKKIALFEQAMQQLEFVSVTTPNEQIKANFEALETLENEIKQSINEMCNNDFFKDIIKHNIKETFEKYLSQKWNYFGQQIYYQTELDLLFSSLHNFAYVLSKGLFMYKKQLLDYKAGLLSKTIK